MKKFFIITATLTSIFSSMTCFAHETKLSKMDSKGSSATITTMNTGDINLVFGVPGGNCHGTRCAS